MTKSRYQYILTWLFFLLTGGTAMAQDGFDPVNPPDPFYYDTYKVTVGLPGNGKYTFKDGVGSEWFDSTDTFGENGDYETECP